MIRCCCRHSRALAAAWRECIAARGSHAYACSSSNPSPSSSGQTKWPKLSRSSSSQAGQEAATKFFQPSYIDTELQFDRGKGKARAIDPTTRRTTIGEIAREARSNIEQEEVWERATARYPGLRREQLRLVAFLWKVTEKAKEAGIMVLPKELWSLHSIILESDQTLQNREGSASLFQRSSVAYTILLKYAHKLQDGYTLKTMAKEALRWRHKVAKRTKVAGASQPVIHPRVAAADQLSRLVRNLFVSLAISQRARLSNGRHKILSGLRLPSSAIKVTRGDEAMTVSALSKHRLGVYTVGETEEGETKLDLSRFAQVSRYPISHTSRRRRRLMRLLERGNLLDFQKALAKEIPSTSARIVQEQGRPSRKLSSHLLEEGQGTSVQKATKEKSLASSQLDSEEASLLHHSPSSSSTLLAPSYNAGVVQLLSQSKTYGSAKEEKMKELLLSYERWHKHLCRRMNTRRTLVSTLKQFNIPPDNVSQEDIDAIRHVIPAWLLLALLRIYIGTGEMKEAERAVAVYLESFQRIHRGKELVDILPYDSTRVHAVTSPFIPPNSPSLLNGMLRACMSNGGGDCFESMTQIMDRWCYEGARFSSVLVLEKKKSKAMGEDSVRGMAIPPAGRSLLPDSTTVCIMLEALRNRKKKYYMGTNLVHEMWQRWGVIGSPGEARLLDFVEPNRHSKLVIPLRAFTTLLSWTLLKNTPKRERKMARIQAMQAQWERGTSTEGPWPVREHFSERVAWNRVRAKAQANIQPQANTQQQAKQKF